MAKKITIKTVITRYAKKKGPGCFSIGLGDVKLTEEQRNQLDDMIDNSEEIKLSIELVQAKLPGME